MSARGQKTEDRGQMVVCRYAARATKSRGEAATKRAGNGEFRGTAKPLPSVLCPLSSERGFTLIELVIVITIVVILASVLLNRALYYQEQAEKAAMQQVAGALQSALTLQYGRLITRGLETNAPALAVENPMNWLAKIPDNYAGEIYDVTPHSVSPDNWIFDLKTRNLIYVIDRGDHFTPGKDGRKWVRYHVNLLYEAAPGTPVKEGKELVGILFEPIEPYKWLDLE